MEWVVDCPDADDYRRLASGELMPEAVEPLLSHLEDCAACAHIVQTLPVVDTLSELIREVKSVAMIPPSRLVLQHMEQLSQLRPESIAPFALHPTAATLGYAISGDLEPWLERFAPPQATDEIGRLGHYRILAMIGYGGMGAVFEAEDIPLQRLVALKAILPRHAANPISRERFLREARSAANVRHDHIVAVYQVGEDRGVPYLAMELLAGESLESRLQRQGTIALGELIRMAREMALGLSAAHQRGVIHRDIKPANVWLEAGIGRVKLLDFGLARSSEDRTLTQEGVILGTPAYMSPEQARGQITDARGDLFSLGCVLYQMATGEFAFPGTDVVSTLLSIVTHTPIAPNERNPIIPSRLSELIMHLLAKNPADRPISADAVVTMLDQIAENPTRFDSKSQPRRMPIRWGGLVLVVLLVIGGLWAAGVLKLRTAEGTIVIDQLPANAVVRIDGEAITLTAIDTEKPIEVRAAPGKRMLEVTIAGVKIESQEITLAAGERKPIHLRMEPPAPLVPMPPPAALVPPVNPPEVPKVKPPQPRIRREATVILGEWEILGDELIQRNTDRAFPVVLFGDPTWKDYDFSVDAMRIEGGDQFALYFHVEDSNSLYWFGLAEWGNTLTQFGSKPRDHVMKREQLALHSNHWYTARIQVRGTEMTCSLHDGERKLTQFTMDDSRHPMGRVGLRTCCSAVRFRNIRVTAPDGKVLWEGPPDLPGQPTWIPPPERSKP